MRRVSGFLSFGSTLALALTLCLAGCSGQQSDQTSAEKPQAATAAPSGSSQSSTAATEQPGSTGSQTAGSPTSSTPESTTPTAAETAGSAAGAAKPSGQGRFSETAPSASAAAGKPKPAESTAGEPKQPAPAPRTSLAGRWVLTLTQNGTDFKAALLEFQPLGQQGQTPVFSCRLVETTSVLPPAQLKQAEAVGQDVHLVLAVEEDQMDFRGRFRDGTVRGNVLFGAGRCDPARLEPTELETLKNERLYGPTPGLSELRKAVQADDPVAAVGEFCQKFASSPLAAEAYGQLLLQAGSKGWDAAQVKQIAERYVEQAGRWGQRFADFARVTVGLMLSSVNYDPDVTLGLLEQAERQVPAEILSTQREALEAAKANARAERGRRLVESDDPQKRAEGARILSELREQRPFDPSIAYALARYAEREGRKDEAIRLYAEVAVLPMAEQMLLQQWASLGSKELPSEALARLWKEKHGSTEGLEAFLDKVYSERIYSFAEARKQPTVSNGHVILCELFTGSQCPPCVAADIALGGVAHTYPQTEVVVLRYHQHIPGPDPMANPDTAQRFQYYQARGTPTLVVDGRKVSGVGGFLIHVPEVYARIRRPIDEILGRARPSRSVKIALKAVAENGVLKVSAKVDSKEPLPDTVRLRLVLAEDEVSYVARNGVRKHEMIVRKMLGGPSGVGPQDGRLSYEGEVSLSDLRTQLESYLTNFEKTRGYRFPARPLDLRALHVVAFVQDDATREVWQTALVPVTGELEARSPQTAEKASSSKPAAQKPTAKGESPAKGERSAAEAKAVKKAAGGQTPPKSTQPKPAPSTPKAPSTQPTSDQKQTSPKKAPP